ncbi:hypothetical protein PIB30_042906 [Stylosanthes scabra]|uniref:Uncharacterized protein n=1 Tax=Stylosanthes scabra TaxID=79078 RepID=A0ABU6TFI3_9FABA|nr:hypothetical protein [Stylosanthes scabra]
MEATAAVPTRSGRGSFVFNLCFMLLHHARTGGDGQNSGGEAELGNGGGRWSEGGMWVAAGKCE